MRTEKTRTHIQILLTFDEVSEIGQAHIAQEELTDVESLIRENLVDGYCCDDCGEYLQTSVTDHKPYCAMADEDDEDLDDDEEDEDDDDLDFDTIPLPEGIEDEED